MYIHGHSAGGTNPSLCEAMYLGLPIIAFSNGYNENTTNYQAKYFKDADELCKIIKSINKEELDAMRPLLKNYAVENYRWEHIARMYEKIFMKVIEN